MNVIICIVLGVLSLWGSYFCFVDLEDDLLGTCFGGIFFVCFLYTILVAIRDFTGRTSSDEGEL